MCVGVCVCARVCVRACVREREREREMSAEREREREREMAAVVQCKSFNVPEDVDSGVVLSLPLCLRRIV